MATYSIRWKASSQKELQRLPKQVIARVVAAVNGLADDQHPLGSRKLVGSTASYRIRVGDYRVVYEVLSDEVVVEVVRIRHRRDVYR